AHPAAQLAAVHIGEPDIEEDRVEPLAPRRGERLCGCVAFDSGKLAVLLQLLGQRMAQCRVVLDDQDLAKTAHTLSALLPTPFRLAARRAGVALRPGRGRAGARGGIRR